MTLAGCGPAAPDSRQAKAADAIAGIGQRDCLTAVWQAQAAPDKAFDRAHDQADGGTISCATGTSASQFAAVLAAIRSAAARGDRTALLAEVGPPLLYIDKSGDKRELDQKTVAVDADEVFSPPMLALLSRLTLDDLSVVPREGAFADLGAVWLVTGRTGGRPRIVTIDRRALDEAASAKHGSRTPRKSFN